jgi:PqqD family protein of HPr-rel-A system
LIPGLEPSAVWSLPNGVVLSWRCWDGEYIVLNYGSGQTHLLDALSAWVLQKIEASPSAPNVLLKHLVQELGLAEDKLAYRMNEILTEFEKQGLAEPSQDLDESR